MMPWWGAYSTTGEWMRSGFCVLSASLAAGMALVALPNRLLAQQAVSSPAVVAIEALPEAPHPQLGSGLGDLSDEQTAASQQTPPVPVQSTPQPTPATAPPPATPADSSSNSQAQQPAAGSSSSQTDAASQSDAQKAEEKRRKAQEQLQQQEHQRVMGVMATFNTTSNRDAVPLSPPQKFQLFFKSSTDPWPFLLAGVIAGIGQADDSEPPWGQGAQGYAKRFGAAYSDAFIGNFFGNAVLPIMMREDPRYFQKGTGSFTGRALWAAGSTVWCKRDKGGWGPNYANVFGNLIGSAISTAYKPASDRSVGDVITDGLTVSAEGIVGAEVIEFWPDLVRHHKRKKAEKLARQEAQKNAQGAAQTPAPSTPAATPDKPQN
jgi:hypothetical protein